MRSDEPSEQLTAAGSRRPHSPCLSPPMSHSHVAASFEFLLLALCQHHCSSDLSVSCFHLQTRRKTKPDQGIRWFPGGVVIQSSMQERSGSQWSLQKKVNLGIKQEERSWKEGEKDRPLYPMVSQWVGSAGHATAA